MEYILDPEEHDKEDVASEKLDEFFLKPRNELVDFYLRVDMKYSSLKMHCPYCTVNLPRAFFCFPNILKDAGNSISKQQALNFVVLGPRTATEESKTRFRTNNRT